MAILTEVEQLFLKELAARDITPTRRDDGCYSLTVGAFAITANLENLSKEFEKDPDPTRVTRFVEAIFDSLAVVPSWPAAKAGLRLAAEPADYEFGDALVETISRSLRRVLVHVDPQEKRIVWLTPALLESWGQTREAIEHFAALNMADLMSRTRVKARDVDGHRLGIFLTETSLEASLIFSPNFKEVVAPVLGWPVLVMIPHRELAYLVAEEEQALLGSLGHVVVAEHHKSGYPISTEVFRLSDDGIDAIGSFQPFPEPTDEDAPSEGMLLVRHAGVSFPLPDDWEEEVDEEGGAEFYPDEADGGTLRLNVITVESASDEPVGEETIMRLAKRRARDSGSQVTRLPSGNALIFYAQNDPEGDEATTCWFWEIVGAVPPRQAHYAIFSFTVPTERAGDAEIVERLKMLNAVLRQCVFEAEAEE